MAGEQKRGTGAPSGSHTTQSYSRMQNASSGVLPHEPFSLHAGTRHSLSGGSEALQTSWTGTVRQPMTMSLKPVVTVPVATVVSGGELASLTRHPAAGGHEGD